MYNQRSASDIFEDIAEPTKFMNPKTGTANIGAALRIVFLPHSPEPMETVHCLAFFDLNATFNALLFPVTVRSVPVFLA